MGPATRLLPANSGKIEYNFVARARGLESIAAGIDACGAAVLLPHNPAAPAYMAGRHWRTGWWQQRAMADMDGSGHGCR